MISDGWAVPDGLDRDQWDYLRAVAVGGAAIEGRTEPEAASVAELVQVEVSSCAYSCCSRGWHRREQGGIYRGYVDNLDARSFMLYSAGLGTISYVCAIRFDEVSDVYALSDALRG